MCESNIYSSRFIMIVGIVCRVLISESRVYLLWKLVYVSIKESIIEGMSIRVMVVSEILKEIVMIFYSLGFRFINRCKVFRVVC